MMSKNPFSFFLAQSKYGNKVHDDDDDDDDWGHDTNELLCNIPSLISSQGPAWDADSVTDSVSEVKVSTQRCPQFRNICQNKLKI